MVKCVHYAEGSQVVNLRPLVGVCSACCLPGAELCAAHVSLILIQSQTLKKKNPHWFDGIQSCKKTEQNDLLYILQL